MFVPFYQDAEKQEEERRQRLKERASDKIVDVDLEESGLGADPVPVTKRLVLQKEPLVEVRLCCAEFVRL